MQIYKEVFDLIVVRTCKNAGRELGGVLGCDRSGDICLVEFEDPNSKDKWYTYTPNVDYMNKVIAEWLPHFQFAGLLHIHMNNQRCLSAADRAYIKKILSVMPSEITMLHFPLYVLPEGHLYGFKAERTEDGSIEITKEPVTII